MLDQQNPWEAHAAGHPHAEGIRCGFAGFGRLGCGWLLLHYCAMENLENLCFLLAHQVTDNRIAIC